MNDQDPLTNGDAALTPALQYALNRLPIGLVTLDGHGRVLGYSGTAAALLGGARLRESVGKSVLAIHSPAAAGKVEWLLRQARHEGASGFASTLVCTPEKVLQLRVIGLDPAGGLEGYCLLVYDVTGVTSLPAAAAERGDEAGRALVKLPVSTAGRIALLDVDRVSVLEALGHCTAVYVDGERHVCNSSLGQLEPRLPGGRFVRVHRSFLVNLARASAVRRRDEQVVIVMEDDLTREIPVSRPHVPRLRQLLGI